MLVSSHWHEVKSFDRVNLAGGKVRTSCPNFPTHTSAHKQTRIQHQDSRRVAVSVGFGDCDKDVRGTNTVIFSALRWSILMFLFFTSSWTGILFKFYSLFAVDDSENRQKPVVTRSISKCNDSTLRIAEKTEVTTRSPVMDSRSSTLNRFVNVRLDTSFHFLASESFLLATLSLQIRMDCLYK